ncbi:hypothetical protein FB451DRAFT_1236769 [Mycena latifolia]|nr:hypothetical protein FB451DRAFT_1236769 [Mycena latifolia]
MTPVQYRISDAVARPDSIIQLLVPVQDAPDSVCEEFVLVGDHVMRTCFLSLMLRRDLARPNGFFTTVRDLVLSTEVYSALVSKGGIQWRGPNARPAAEAFLIFVAALHTSLSYVDVLNWFRETFFPLLRAAEETYAAYTKHECSLAQGVSPDTYARALDLLAQIKVMQSQWKVWNGGPPTAVPTSISLPKLIWGASSMAGKVAIAPVIRFAIRASVPLKWIRYRKFNETTRSKRRASSILDPRPTRATDAEALCSTTQVLSNPVFTLESPSHLNISQATIPPSNIALSDIPRLPAPMPLRLPCKASYGLRESSWSEGRPLDSSRRAFF